MPRSLVLGQIALLLVASAGCAAKTTRPPMPDHVPNELGAVAVVAPPARPESSFAYPVPSRAGAAAVGAGAGLGAGVLAGAACFVPPLAPACLLVYWTPVMVVTGGVEGAVKGVPIAEFKVSAASLRDAAGEPDLARSLAERVATEAARRVGEGRVRFTADALPEGGAGSARSPGPAGVGVDTVLEVRLERLGLKRVVRDNPGYGWSFSVESLIDAPLTLVVEARVRVLRAADGMTLYKGAFTHRAGGQKFTEWGREGAAAFRRERDLALAAVAEDIASTIFGPAPAPPEGGG